ncbi:MAG: aminotransferase class I/II-fold pyridoxal phosphate-dependent enzyme [Pseudomonadota bacterium]
MKLSTRGQTAPFVAMDVLSEATRLEAGGAPVLHMEVGEPAFGAPRAALEALAAAEGRGETLGYTSGLGTAQLREAIAALYERRHGLTLDPGRIVVTAGSSGAFVLAFLALFEAGDRVALADPGYPAYRNTLSALGLEAVRLETDLATRYQPTPMHLAAARAAQPVQGLLVASPANPTGTMLDELALSALIADCAAHHTALIVDEIYHGITYGDHAVSALEIAEELIVVNSFSKYYAMTGWRIGWMVVPEGLIRPLQNLAQNLYICASHPAQAAALGALSPEGEAEAAGHMADYRRNRETVMTALASLGFRDIAPADGAFYAYATLPAGWEDSMAFSRRLLAEHHVAATPGLDFDPVRGGQTMRFSYAQSPAAIEEAMDRLSRMIAAGTRAEAHGT